MNEKLSKFIVFLIISSAFVSHSIAKTKIIGSYKNWTAYSNKEKNGKTCFIASEPLKSTGKYDKNNRGKTYVFVTNIKGGSNHEVSVVAGFNFKKNTKVKFISKPSAREKIMFIRDQTINGKQNKIIDVCRATSENVLPSRETIIFPTISLEK